MIDAGSASTSIEVEIWQLTSGLRWFKLTDGSTVLQQQWFCCETGETEWETVETVFAQ